MQTIIACVPNFSEGRDSSVIEAIATSISDTKGCTLLDVDPGHSTHRTVYTFVGGPESVIEGALAAARVAKERIDMRYHRGEHPRFGAMDVCPFIPVSNIDMDGCVRISETFAKRAAEELNVPFYLYEASARNEDRRKLPDVRQGEYEALPQRLQDPNWKPDYGPTDFRPAWGATATGARKFLIAYNVNVLGTPNQAHRIALNLREAGRGEDQPGCLKAVKGMGWFVDEYNLSQVTVNLNDFHVTSMHTLFEEVKREAALLGVAVAGSEIVGVVPLEAMLMAADYYIEKEKLFIYEEDQKIRLAIERLGLNSVAHFEPKEKIIEYCVARSRIEPLAGLPVRNFIEAIAARTSAPGGGSASAAVAATGAALGSMVAKLTHGVRKFDAVRSRMEEVIPKLHSVTGELIAMIDADTSAFNEYMEGLRMPRETEEQKAARKARMQAGLKTAIAVPLTTMRLADSLWDAMLVVARHGNPASRSDTQVGARSLETGIWGAYQNVLINMADIEDEAYRQATLAEADGIAARAKEKCDQVLAVLGDV
jgi:glutamate formiminotransferase/formiminotetrahydrofolate cyclodeaminase